MRTGELPAGVYRVRKTLASGEEVSYYYDRKTKTRLSEKPGSTAFKRSLAEARAGVAKVVETKTLNDLVATYKGSSHFKTRLRERTRKRYSVTLERIREQYGTLTLAGLESIKIRASVQTWLDEIAEESLQKADFTGQVFSTLVSFGYKRGIIKVHHLMRLERYYEVDRSDCIWEPRHIEAFCRVAPESMRWALAFGLYTGQRKGDLLKLTRSQFDGEGFHIVQEKTGAKVFVPVVDPLKQVMDQIPDNPHGLYLTAPMGGPWDHGSFNAAFKAAKVKAGQEVDKLHFHDLRGTFATRLAEAGNATSNIATITGHTLKSANTIMERYLSRTKTLARATVRRLEEANSIDPANWLLTGQQPTEIVEDRCMRMM